MMFDQILETLRSNGKSGAAYTKTIALAEKAMTEDADRAVAYGLLCDLGERFIDSTGRLPVTSVQIDKAFEEFAQATSDLKAAYENGSAEETLQTLNRIASLGRTPLDLSK
ncbi:hypothetical protein [Neptunicoccus cionae]|uniref:hypothetical protein n=1 Tax=Neptunicoccus cionae TaxID=2035344 RepID=UPI000C794D16|nr:hypothetical protein [Amylibacter cionae]PLS20440.1 hypothetical protein C0U40_17575 [Amylibacter cionae]